MNVEKRKRTKSITIATVALVSVFLAVCLTTAPAMAADFWVSDSDIVSGLGDIGDWASPAVFCKDETWYLISGENEGAFYGFKWNLTGSTWESEPAIVSGLSDVGSQSVPAVFYKDGTWYLISGRYEGTFYGFNWTGSVWQSDPAIVSGLSDVGDNSAPAVFYTDWTWYLISGEKVGGFYGFKWNLTGSTWESDPAIVSGLGAASTQVVPAVFYRNETWYLVSGEYNGVFNGFNWTGSVWQSDPAIASGLGDVGLRSAPAVFYTDWTWYLISGEKFGGFHGFHHKEPAPAIEVNETVWNPVSENWVKETTAKVNDTLRFRCVINNTGAYSFTNITVVDILSESLNYSNGSATVNGVPQEPVKVGNEYKWNFTGPLEPSHNITIEFNASAVKCGSDTNIQNATAWCEQTGTWGFGEDFVSVIVPCPDIDVNKTVWDPAGEAWMKEVTAKVNDTLRFRCVINNTGAYSLTNITVVDILPDCLNYSNGSATVSGVPDEPVKAGNEYTWNFTGPLEPSHNITIEFNASAVKCGSGTNTQNATAWCEQAGTWVSAEDSVSVIVSAMIPTPFLVYGFVYFGAEPVNNPNVVITNLNTDEVFIAETNVSFNYYQVLTSSGNVSANQILHFYASNAVIKEFNHTVTREEIDNGGFVQNVSLAGLPEPKITSPLNDSCICGVVTIEAIDESCEEDIVYSLFEYYNDTNCNCIADDGNSWTEIGNDTAPPEWNVSWNTTAVDNGCYIIKATMGDVNGLTGSDEINVRINNLPPDLIVSEVNAYHYYGAKEWSSPWFNLTNYVDVTVKNNGTADAGVFNVSLYADDDLIGEQCISNLSGGSSETLVFEWKPEGEDPLGWTDTAEGAIFSYTDTSKTYTLKAVADEDEEVSEEDEGNNNHTSSEEVVWNGYMADEPLENYAHGKVRGGIIYTTGDGMYHSGEGQEPGTKYGTYYEVNYDLEIPSDTKLARLYFYYTWAKPGGKAPKVGATLKTPSDDIHVLNMEKSYSETKGSGAWNLPWGTYAYNITEYVPESGTYVVNITNLNDPDNFDDRFAQRYSFAAPAILVVYENETMPEREYWINEGADVLIGGRRGDGGFLSLEECINNATFPGSVDLSRVENATLAVVSPWGDAWENALYFNGIELGTGVYDLCGYVSGPDEASLDGIRMSCIYGGTQVGMNLTDVTGYLNASVNIAGQGDNGDNMMPVNAFLVVEYIEEAPPGICGDVNDDKSVDIGDIILLGNHVRYPELYPVNEWAADVNCDHSIDIGDLILLGNHVRYSELYPLGCCA